jgi:hypothetical protein
MLPKKLNGLVDTTTGKAVEVKRPSVPFGDTLVWMSKPWDTIEKWYTPNRLVTFWQLNDPIVSTCDPDISQSILAQKDSNFKRDFGSLYLLHRLEGHGVIAVDGGKSIIIKRSHFFHRRLGSST